MTSISPRRHLDKYPNYVFVETGTFLGDGVQDALNCDFKKIYSFEVGADLVKSVKARFQKNENVQIIQDTSANMYQYIKDIGLPITFWLDAHWSQGITSYQDVYCPILKELDAISQHSVKTHTILIDDIRLFGTWEFNHITLEQVKEKVLEINKDYKFEFLDGHVKGDVLGCWV